MTEENMEKSALDLALLEPQTFYFKVQCLIPTLPQPYIQLTDSITDLY
jgi:hypothetical protein